jgi:sporulation protein YlmC with PRC-barrel domain
MSEYERNLHRFSDMDDVEVAEEDPDVRGWDVVTRDGRGIGEVKDLLVDTGSMKVRCLEVELEASHFNWNDNRRVAIPVESVRLDEAHDDVVVQGLEFDEIGRLQEYRPLQATPGMRTAADQRRAPDTSRGREELAGRAPSGVTVEKGPVVKEELVVNKERVEDTRNLEADGRKERFDAEKEGRIPDEGDQGRRRRR